MNTVLPRKYRVHKICVRPSEQQAREMIAAAIQNPLTSVGKALLERWATGEKTGRSHPQYFSLQFTNGKLTACNNTKNKTQHEYLIRPEQLLNLIKTFTKPS